MIIATAGHVDHGKTALLQALTGTDADRLPEEKKRGMTVDLGYAYWPQPDGRVLGFIDVPGHEKFLANMLSGIGGINHALLVVACDDGVMPQTWEHLTLLKLAGQPPITVALTKTDRVDEARIAEVAQQTKALTQQLGWINCSLFPVSSLTGDGLDALRQHLGSLQQRETELTRPFRLAIDRAFTIKGTGLVVTGTAHAGQVRTGDRLWLTSINQPVRVRSLHAQNQPTEQAGGGQRIALNISGDVEKAQIHRGDWLLATQQKEGVSRLIVALDALQPLQQWQPVHIYHAASHITGRVSLLENNLAELVLDTPLWLADNDRLILRDISARQTLAAARVIVLNSKRRGKRQPDYLQWLHQLAAAQDDRAAIRVYLQQQPCLPDTLSWARQLQPEALQQVLDTLQPVVAGGWLLSPEMAQRWQRQMLEALAHFHQQHSDQPGVGRERLRRMALPDVEPEIGRALIDELIAHGELINRQGWLHLPAFEPAFSAEEAQLWQRVAPLFLDDPLWVRDIANQLGEDEERIRQLLLTAAQLGHVTAIVRDRYYRSDKILIFADLIRQRAATGGATSAADFRNQLGTGRKIAIQLLEFFDRSGFTRRRGNDHLLRDSALFSHSQ
ncbi:selenocysteine-specific translation elongation factor [Mixta sp. Marseille-Q2659]|uniref:selenocysteine-specific translation elongation factor n=1 Tax=Mixta sp. Marseille-Q2659 TaxID=2736607 RepID=UPI0023B9B6AA|nr:selenocysteine-specific translation elongation factor [Mixta sp. Marseille-Q2659]